MNQEDIIISLKHLITYLKKLNPDHQGLNLFYQVVRKSYRLKGQKRENIQTKFSKPFVDLYSKYQDELNEICFDWLENNDIVLSPSGYPACSIPLSDIYKKCAKGGTDEDLQSMEQIQGLLCSCIYNAVDEEQKGKLEAVRNEFISEEPRQQVDFENIVGSFQKKLLPAFQEIQSKFDGGENISLSAVCDTLAKDKELQETMQNLVTSVAENPAFTNLFGGLFGALKGLKQQ